MMTSPPNATSGEDLTADNVGQGRALDSVVPVRIVRIAELIARSANEVYSGFGIKNTELRILIQLKNEPALAVNELSRRTRVDKGWISRSLDALEKRGLVWRAPHQRDSRIFLVSLSEQGETLLDSFVPVAWERNRRMLEGLDETELHRILDVLSANAEQLLNEAAARNSAPSRPTSRESTQNKI